MQGQEGANSTPEPPWWEERRRRWGGPDHAAQWHGGQEWHRKRRFLLLRFLSFFVSFLLLVLGGMGALAVLITNLASHGHAAVFVWLGGIGLALTLPLVALRWAVRTFRRYAYPLAEIMAAADAVAAGDLTVEVSETGAGEFRQLAQSFNHMTAELARSDQQRRNLTADVAHELRTPLHIIQGNLEGILDGIYEPTPDHLHATLDATHTLARLVEDLRILSLAEAGQLPLQHEPVDLAELLTDVVTTFSPQAESTGIALTLVAATPTTTTPFIIQGDAGRLDQVFSNLVANALRHTPAGGAVTLQLTPQADQVLIRVTDTGEGIAPEDLPLIFERFWKGDRARSHLHNPGSGLGLSIARQLVQAHGGQISVQSRQGVGTTFEIALPGGGWRGAGGG
ncbi:MAG: HAMP domain-containing sensor histidine kinase [Caldilineaceae bacterium]